MSFKKALQIFRQILPALTTNSTKKSRSQTKKMELDRPRPRPQKPLVQGFSDMAAWREKKSWPKQHEVSGEGKKPLCARDRLEWTDSVMALCYVALKRKSIGEVRW